MYDSGEIFSAVTQWTPPANLPNDTYRAFIWIADAGSNGHYSTATSAGPYSSATVNVTLPVTPTMTAALDAANGRITLVVTGHDTSPTAQRFEIDRSIDGGTTWTQLSRAYVAGSGVSDLSGIAPVAQVVTAYDYEAQASSVAVQYRARTSLLLGGTGARVSGAFCSPVSVSVPVTNAWWLKAIYNPLLNWKFHPLLSDLEWKLTYDELQGVEHPLGMDREVVMSDSVTGAHIPWDASMTTDAEYATYTALRIGKTPMLLQTPWGDQFYVRFTGSHSVMRIVDGGTAEQIRTVSSALTEIAVPA
jgi:hypothetical protein